MEKTKLVSLLCDLVEVDLTGRNLPLDFYENKYDKICDKLGCTYQDIGTTFKKLFELYFSSESIAEWKYIHLGFYILHLLNDELESQGEILSVQQSKNVKNCLKSILKVGICTNLLPNLPLYIKTQQIETKDIFLNYNILKCTTFGLCEFLKFPNLRILILPDSLRAILVAMYQICHCPLKKPMKEGTNSDSIMTEDIYTKLLEERELFLELLEHLRQTIHPGIFVKETMAILQANAPTWFKKSVSKSLTSIIRSDNGVENIATALFDGVTNDSTQTWKILEVFSKLILSCKNFPDFEDNICKQLLGMLDKVTNESLVFERIYTHCTKSIYQVDQELAKHIFVDKIVTFFSYFTNKNHRFGDSEVLTKQIKQYVRLVHAIFFENSPDIPSLPVELLKPSANVIFRLYATTLNTSFKSTNNELQDILIAFLNSNPDEIFILFDNFLFGVSTGKLLSFRNDVILEVEKEIILNYSEHVVSYSTANNSECILKLLKNETNFMVNLFGFLLNCLTNNDKYFKKANDDLLNLEMEFMNEFFERRLTVYKLLSELAEDKIIQKHITGNPGDIIRYIKNVLERTIETSTHKITDFETDEFQSVFTIIMILQLLVSNCSASKLESYKTLIQPLTIILNETSNDELKELVRKILDMLEEGTSSKKLEPRDIETELDKTIDDICDPLLPVRGHGLMTLTKLVEKKDRSVMERKHYVLNIFQQNLKNEDSFIYLTAIGGLAAMADVFPDTVLNILCEEYSDNTKKSDHGHEIRMKLGESLVRVTKILGDMAPKYKPLLLNTFLIGAKDDDHLIRASSLSNLGEVCRVLGYKLGTIVSEVLVCVHAVIATDKSPEARRAAVTVIRQLLAGLDSEMIAFLKEDILPIYRTLKEIYNNDRDDVMRLQAQLALEELNENMRNFVFPKPQLSMEKIVMLN